MRPNNQHRWPDYTYLVATRNTTAHDSDAIVQQLLELNQEISAGKRRYIPFGDQAAAMDELPLQDLSGIMCHYLW